MILGNHHVLAVPNTQRTAEFFVDVLGFTRVMEGGGWTFVRRDNCMFMLGECPDALPAAEIGDHAYVAYLWVDDVDAFWERVSNGAAEITSPLADRPWGMKEFGLRTPDGHRIMIGQDLELE